MPVRRPLGVAIFVAIVVAAGIAYVVATAGSGPAAGEVAGPVTAPSTAPGVLRAPSAPGAPGAPAARRLPGEVLGRLAEARKAAVADPRLKPLAEAFARAAEGRPSARAEDGEALPDEAHGVETPAGPRKTWKIDRDGIQGAINESIPQIQQCYEAWLGLNPELSGKIVAKLTIAPPDEDAETAQVKAVRVGEGGLGNQFVEGCVLSVLSELQFERPEDGGEVEVNYPFVFKSIGF